MSSVIEIMNNEMGKHCQEGDVDIIQWFEETLNNAFPPSVVKIILVLIISIFFWNISI